VGSSVSEVHPPLLCTQILIWSAGLVTGEDRGGGPGHLHLEVCLQERCDGSSLVGKAALSGGFDESKGLVSRGHALKSTVSAGATGEEITLATGANSAEMWTIWRGFCCCCALAVVLLLPVKTPQGQRFQNCLKVS